MVRQALATCWTSHITPSTGEFIQLQANGQWQNVELDPAAIGALKPGDNVSELVNDANYLAEGDDISKLNNDAGYLTSADSPVSSVNGKTGAVVLNADDVGAVAPGDAVSDLNNDAGYITEAEAPVTTVNGKTGDVVLSATDVGALKSGDNVSELVNDANYITAGDLPPGAGLWTQEDDKLYPTDLPTYFGVGIQTPNRTLHVRGAGGNTPAANEIYLEKPDGKACQFTLASKDWNVEFRNTGDEAGDCSAVPARCQRLCAHDQDR